MPKSKAMIKTENEANIRIDDFVKRVLEEECGIKHRLGERRDLCPRCQEKA